MAAIRILLVDNYDSYTFNLFQYFARVNKKEPIVIRNNQFQWKQLEEFISFFDAVVISPGPGNPCNQKDFGVCTDLLKYCNLPIFGVCLGHQGFAHILGGAKIVALNSPVHGQTSKIYHDDTGIFKSIPSPFNAVRYHSLTVSRTELNPDIKVTAWVLPELDSNDTELLIMGLCHATKPIWSVQFHPESICTEYGINIIENFCNLVTMHWKEKALSLDLDTPVPLANHHSKLPFPGLQAVNAVPRPLVLSAAYNEDEFLALIRKIDHQADPEIVFKQLYAHCSSAFWLDSSKIEKGQSRWSYMGDVTGPCGFKLEYELCTKTVTRFHGDEGYETLVLNSGDKNSDTTFFEYIGRIMKKSSCRLVQYDTAAAPIDRDEVHDVLPPFIGGLVGYFGYEMKTETLYNHNQQENDSDQESKDYKRSNNSKQNPEGPDSGFMFSDQVIAFDHELQCMYIIGLIPLNDYSASVRKKQTEWITATSEFVTNVGAAVINGCTQRQQPPITRIPEIKLAHTEEEYTSMIKQSLDKIRQGETYEVCLTTQLSTNLAANPLSPLDFYLNLRKENSAPYAAYLSLKSDFVVCCSSPERFMRVDGDSGKVTMKPIKGTLQRATRSNFKNVHGIDNDKVDEYLISENEQRITSLQNSVKNTSENLMIVDLIRNDLNQVSVIDSVHVPTLMAVESYATVHQLVSTVASTLGPGLTPIDALKASFPPGSMTGAPKLRTVEIIESLEKIPRGVYSGTLGFFSVTGHADFNVIIRTAIFHKHKDSQVTNVSIGAGGAIVVLSEPKEEFEEMVLKAQSVLPSLYSTFKDYFI